MIIRTQRRQILALITLFQVNFTSHLQSRHHRQMDNRFLRLTMHAESALLNDTYCPRNIYQKRKIVLTKCAAKWRAERKVFTAMHDYQESALREACVCAQRTKMRATQLTAAASASLAC